MSQQALALANNIAVCLLYVGRWEQVKAHMEQEHTSPGTHGAEAHVGGAQPDPLAQAEGGPGEAGGDHHWQHRQYTGDEATSHREGQG